MAGQGAGFARLPLTNCLMSAYYQYIPYYQHMKEQKCAACNTMNELGYTLRPGNTGPITIRCKRCKKLLRVEAVEAPKE